MSGSTGQMKLGPTGGRMTLKLYTINIGRFQPRVEKRIKNRFMKVNKIYDDG